MWVHVSMMVCVSLVGGGGGEGEEIVVETRLDGVALYPDSFSQRKEPGKIRGRMSHAVYLCNIISHVIFIGWVCPTFCLSSRGSPVQVIAVEEE